MTRQETVRKRKQELLDLLGPSDGRFFLSERWAKQVTYVDLEPQECSFWLRNWAAVHFLETCGLVIVYAEPTKNRYMKADEITLVPLGVSVQAHFLEIRWGQKNSHT